MRPRVRRPRTATSISPGRQPLRRQPAEGRRRRASCSRDLRLLVAAQPTRGVDVGSIEYIHKQVVATRDSGIAVLVVSTELDEVVALSDRIMVLYRGRIVGVVPADTPRETLGLMMTGERPKDLEDAAV